MQAPNGRNAPGGEDGLQQHNEALVDCLADRLVEIGDGVPKSVPSFRLAGARNPFADPRL